MKPSAQSERARSKGRTTMKRSVNHYPTSFNHVKTILLVETDYCQYWINRYPDFTCKVFSKCLGGGVDLEHKGNLKSAHKHILKSINQTL